MYKVETGRKVIDLHTKYIINGDKPQFELTPGIPRNLTCEEMREIVRAFEDAPRIGRVRNNRKRADELIAVPRGLLGYYCDQAQLFAYFHDQWKEGKLEK